MYEIRYDTHNHRITIKKEKLSVALELIGPQTSEFLKGLVETANRAAQLPDAPAESVGGKDVHTPAAVNCFNELHRYAFKYDEPDKETALKIIERYFAAFSASSLPPNGRDDPVARLQKGKYVQNNHNERHCEF